MLQPHARSRFLIVLVTTLALGTGGVLLASAQEAGPVRAGDASSPTYVNYVAPPELGRDAGEPSIGANWNSGRVMYQSGLESLQVTFDEASPPTASWKDVSPGITSTTTLDPILTTDPVTGRTFVSQLLPPCSLAALTDTDGEGPNPNVAWRPFGGCGVGANFDHQTVGVGPSVNPAPAVAYQGRSVYYCSQVILEASCARSIDGGNTFAQSRPVYTAENLGGCVGLHGHLKVGPNGFAYLPNFQCDEGGEARSAVVVSEDDGLTWTIRKIPDAIPPDFDSDPSVGIDANNRVYVAYESRTSNLMLATSDDAGRTWTPSVDLGAPFGIDNAVFPAVVAGSAGRAAVAFLGTEAEAPLNASGQPENQRADFDPDEGDPQKGWHLYVSSTYDGGATWETVDATPTDPVQRGCIWWGGDEEAAGGAVCESNPNRNLLDFIDASIDAQGRVLVAYADGCVEECATDADIDNNAGAFKDDIAVIARQQCGRGLFEEFDTDPTGPLAQCQAPEPPAPTRSDEPSPPDVPSPTPSVDPTPTPTSDEAEVERVSGDSRTETAVEVSATAFPDGAETVLLARQDLYPDALAGGPLAFDRAAPLLLTDSARLSPETAEEISRLGAERAILLGGTQAIREEVRTELEEAGLEVERIGGENRFDTAALIAGALGPEAPVAFLAEGANADPARGFPDALSAAPYAAFAGRPILLATKDALPAETGQALRRLGTSETIVVGGAAAVSDAVVAQIEDAGHGPRRLAGDDRYATSVAVYDEAIAAGMDPSVLWLATGTDWPDALTSGPAVAALGETFLLVDPADLDQSPATAQAIEDRRDLLRLVRLIGGPGAISPDVQAQVEELLAEE